MLSIRQLEVFWAIMRTGSITNAGQFLGVSQPAVSRFLRRTEDQIGMKLFQRKRGRLQPTAEAQILFPIVENIFDNIETVRRASLDLRDSLSGRIKIAAIPTLAAELLPGPIRAFLRDRSLVKVGIKVLPTRQVIDRVIRQQVDIGILYGPVEETSLTALDICSTEIVAVIPRTHALATRTEITPQDLAGERLITVNPASPWGLSIERAFASCGVERSATLECNHSFISYALVDSDVGVAVVEPLLASEHRFRNVVVKPFRPRLEIRPQVIYRADSPLSRLNATFIRHLGAVASELSFVGPAGLSSMEMPTAPRIPGGGPSKRSKM